MPLIMNPSKSRGVKGGFSILVDISETFSSLDVLEFRVSFGGEKKGRDDINLHLFGSFTI